MMQILIVGGTNFIIPPVHHLIAMGHEVTLFHRGETKADLRTQVQHVLADRYTCSTSSASLNGLPLKWDMIPTLSKMLRM